MKTEDRIKNFAGLACYWRLPAQGLCCAATSVQHRRSGIV